ncbi:MAG: hypothetical protein HUU46_24210 [Candidatus Hydrogenedentes bacterium]|nr:hypothetical protein [Candidatus Hydrogenedentota bacterium]
MNPNLARCPRCGKIFAAQAGKSLCAKCNTEFLDYGDRVLDAIEKHGLRQPDEIAEFTGVPLDTVIDLVENSTLLSHEIEQERVCAACKERLAQKHSEYCFHCRLMLNKAFGDAVKLMGEIRERELRLKKKKKEDASVLLPSVDDAVKHKRTRRSLHRPDPTPKSRYSP